ncbi:MAG: 16S rRNA (guanine(966)-N(2))-methyltransferase RsmD [Gammaproteobacteria bacterium]
MAWADWLVSMRRGELRIVGGTWRSRRIRFPAVPGLRPTPDRLRETLFDWLGPWIEGRRVLDLYAGSGALGLEALSRGAREAVFVERSRTVAAALRENLAALGAADAGRIECADALAFLHSDPDAFDLVFLDPPWASGLATASLTALATDGRLTTDHRVYLELRATPEPTPLPTGWTELVATRVGEAVGQLLAHSESMVGSC